MASIPEITPRDLVRQIEERRDVHVLDVRAPARLESGRIDIVPDERFHNIKGSDLLGFPDMVQSGLPTDSFLAVVCGHGNDSRVVAAHLNACGYPSASLAGGMAAWMRVTVPRELPAPEGIDRLVQIDRIGKGALGYVVLRDRKALIVDPPRQTSSLLRVVLDAGAEVVGVADTHAHADYISGGPELSRQLSVPYYLHPRDAVDPYDGRSGKIPFEAVEDGREITVGGTRVSAVHTPGHTEGHLCYRIGDDAILSGDFLFVESIGRPDLGDRTEEWTPVLWRSVVRAKLEWPENAVIYPAHYSSARERRADHSVGAAFGDLSRSNEPLTLDEAGFTDWVLSRTGSFPDAYRRIKAINLGLEIPSDAEMDELEVGRNQCALG